MRPSPLFLSAGFLLLACGSRPAASPPPRSSPPGSTAPTSAAPSATPETGPCLAQEGSRLTPNTEEIATAVIHLGADSCTVDLRTAAGPVTTSECRKDQPRPSMRAATCQVGGDVWIANHQRSDEKAGTLVLSIARFKNRDPKADLALICTPFAQLKEPGSGRPFGDMPTLDLSQKSRVRAEALGEGLTSREWRLWLYSMALDSQREASVAKLRDAAKAAGVDCQAEWVIH